MLAGEVSIFTAESGHRDGTFAFQKPDHGCHRVLGRNRNTHVNMVWHQMTLNDLALLLSSQSMEDRSQVFSSLAKDYFPSALGHEYHVILAVPF
jgi:hypothetical protein